ncbi:MAG: hypothetical protein HYU58_20695 [Proteobacteria bacterium]|nr:hypothetical protein [Pseudomonadota bacterium]
MAMTIPLRLLRPEHAPKATALGNLAASIPPETTLYLMTDDPAHPDFVAWAARHALASNCEFISAGADAPVLESEMWSQDPWMIADQDGRQLIHYPTNSDRPGRQARWFAASRGLSLERPAMQLAGGNTVTGPDFRILGASSVEMTRWTHPGGLSWTDALARHLALDPRPISIFGFALPGSVDELRQQPSHLDLVLSVTGLAAANGRSILLLADPRSGHAPDSARTPGWAEQLDATARRLEADGFVVKRNPVAYVADPRWSPNPNLRAYNNVLLENETRPGKSRPLVWLPQFADLEPQLEGFDEANRTIWQELGFEPLGVHGFSALVRAGGGIRCASKVLQRTAFQVT